MSWRITGLLVLLIALLAGQQWRERVVVQREFDRVTGLYVAQALIAEQAARNKERAMYANITKVINESKIRETKLLADAGRARSALERLRNTVAATSRSVPGDTATASDSPDSVGQLFLECGEALVGLGKAADRHASDAVMLQDAWPTQKSTP